MKTIQITVSDELERSLNSVTDNINEFIAETIEKTVQKSKTEETEKILIEGYRACADEAGQLTKEFEKIDLENWDEY